MIIQLKQIREHISHRGLGITISDLKKLCADHHLGNAMGKIEAVENDYELMTHFFASGFEDKQRTALYSKLERRLYNIILAMLIDCIADQNPTFKQCRTNALSMPFEYEEIEETLSRYDQELALASLDENAEEKEKNIHQRLLRYRIFLFNTIYTSLPWNQNESDIMTKVLLSPLVDVIDQQIILGAILMAQRTVFDVCKFKTLCEVALQTDNKYVRARALVGIALGLPDNADRDVNGDIINNALNRLLAKNGFEKEFCDLQIQLFFCMDTLKNEKTITKEILPTILKNSKSMMDKQESEDDKLDSLFNPDHEEKSMEEVEKCVDKMREMQKNGADIFFSGFSGAKRFAFFYTLMNWFCPFYIEHPQIINANSKNMPMPFLKKITVGQYFCNSDKFSFVLSLAHVINQMPKDLLDMMQKGEVSPGFDDNTSDNSAFIRRSYLSDLYRFFYLYSDKNNFKNPFDSEESVCFFLDELMIEKFRCTQYPLRVSRQLLKRHYSKALRQMIWKYSNENDLEWLKVIAISYEQVSEYNLSCIYFNMALNKDPKNNLLLLRTANIEFQTDKYEDALEHYQDYVDNAPEGTDTDFAQYRLALCLFQDVQNDDAMKILFRLSYNHPEEILYHKTIAWGYMLMTKFEEALAAFKTIPSEQLEPLDFLRISISQWLTHKTENAIKTLKRFVELNASNKENNVFDMMVDQLEEIGIYEEYKSEAMILIDLAIR